MSRNLLILGAGQYGLQARDVAQSMNCFDSIGFLDDNSGLAIGKLTDFPRFKGEYNHAFVAIGNPKLRLDLLGRLKECGFTLVVLKHPTSVVMPSASVEEGTILEALTVINANTCIRTGCLICAGALVNHNSEVQQGCHIDCNAVVPSNCIVPTGTKLPCGSVYTKE